MFLLDGWGGEGRPRTKDPEILYLFVKIRGIIKYKKIILEGSLSTVSNPILQSKFSSYSIKKAHYCTVTNATVSQI